MITFDFISDPTLKFMLERDDKELETCFQNGADKSVLVLSGSIIEAILVDYFVLNLPNGKTKEQILRAELKELIDLAYGEELITERSKDLSSVIRNYRNLIHPGKELRENEKFDHDTASVARSLLNMISNEIKEQYLKNRGYTAEELLNKITNDVHSVTIFDKLLSKVSLHEKIKLLNLLTDYDTDIPPEELISDPEVFINILIPYVPQAAIKEQLIKLKNHVEQVSSGYVVMKLYNYYKDYLSLLTEEEIEIIILYVISYLIEEVDKKHVMNYANSKVPSSIGKYLNTEKSIEEFRFLITKIIVQYGGPGNFYYLVLYDLLLNGLPPNVKEKVDRFIEELDEEHKEEFFEYYNNGDYLPF